MKLYELALELIDAGGAYVRHQTAEEIKASRMALRKYYTPEDKAAAAAKASCPTARRVRGATAASPRTASCSSG